MQRDGSVMITKILTATKRTHKYIYQSEYHNNIIIYHYYILYRYYDISEIIKLKLRNYKIKECIRIDDVLHQHIFLLDFNIKAVTKYCFHIPSILSCKL